MVTPSNSFFVSTYVACRESQDDTNFRIVYLPAPCLCEDLKCYLCWSNKSWDECEKDKKIGVCYPEHDEVCITMHHIENDDTEKGYKETFIKMCGQAQLCTNKGCQEKSKTCQVDCCHSDLCNAATGQTYMASRTASHCACCFVLCSVIALYFLNFQLS